MSVVENLAAEIRGGKPKVGIEEAVRDLIESVVVERTKPGEPIRLKVNGRLAALVVEPLSPESLVGG